ncbi:MAG TPA: hypothetical protein PKW90_25725, partial [Myxococcota bacterium]|nr:hypothetical protein [Myxococcota bacterium]
MPIRPVPVRSRLCKPGIPWIFRRFILLGTLAAALVPASVRAQGTPPPPFIIEAEDYNFGSGQTLPIASQMPYLGGAFKGKSNAVSKVDYTRNANNSSPVYRNDKNIPILASPDLDRGSWSVAENYRLVMLGGGATATAEWFNYTRTFPTGKFRAFAAISYGALGDSLAKGSLLRVNNGATNATQPTTSLGTFNGPGSGSWTQNTLVPLKDTKGNVVVFDLGGTQTLRLATESGDFDYLKLVQVFPPVIGQQPVELSVPERHPVTLTVSTVGEDPAFFQWQTNQVAAVNGTNILTRVTISGATTPSLTLNLPLSSGTLLVRCVVTNQAGTT